MAHKVPYRPHLTHYKYLGPDMTDMTKILKLNYNKYLPVITNTIKQWNNRYLTPIGKITIIKTFLLSKLTHLFTSLPTPSDAFIKKIEQQIYQFLWDGKPDKIKRIQLIQQYKKAGLQMIDIKILSNPSKYHGLED